MEREEKMRFMKVYQNLPINERDNVIFVLEETKNGKIKKEPLSWNIAFIEIEQETEIGETILDKLIKLNLI